MITEKFITSKDIYIHTWLNPPSAKDVHFARKTLSIFRFFRRRSRGISKHLLVAVFRTYKQRLTRNYVTYLLTRYILRLFNNGLWCQMWTASYHMNLYSHIYIRLSLALNYMCIIVPRYCWYFDEGTNLGYL